MSDRYIVPTLRRDGSLPGDGVPTASDPLGLRDAPAGQKYPPCMKCIGTGKNIIHGHVCERCHGTGRKD